VLSEIIIQVKKIPFVRDVKIILPLENINMESNQIPRLGIANVEIRETDNG
jgi:hypothetical protein